MKSKDELIQLRKIYLEKHDKGEPLTLEETAIAMWDPNSNKKPMTTMGVLKLQQRALNRLREALKKYHIYNVDDVIGAKLRSFGNLSTIHGI